MEFKIAVSPTPDGLWDRTTNDTQEEYVKDCFVFENHIYIQEMEVLTRRIVS